MSIRCLRKGTPQLNQQVKKQNKNKKKKTEEAEAVAPQAKIAGLELTDFVATEELLGPLSNLLIS